MREMAHTRQPAKAGDIDNGPVSALSPVLTGKTLQALEHKDEGDAVEKWSERMLIHCAVKVDALQGAVGAVANELGREARQVHLAGNVVR